MSMVCGHRSVSLGVTIETWATVLDLGGMSLSQFTSSAMAYVKALSAIDQVSEAATQ
jgi:hypothetical protein